MHVCICIYPLHILYTRTTTLVINRRGGGTLFELLYKSPRENGHQKALKNPKILVLEGFFLFKWTVQRDLRFMSASFFHKFEPACATDQWV